MNIIDGRKVSWSTDAIVYDEQPITFKQSWVQRSRWTVGHLQCMKHYTKDLAEGVVKHKTLMNFDGMLYMFGIPIMLITLLLLGVNTLLFMGNEMTTFDLVVSYGKYLASTFIVPIMIAVVIMKLDKRDIKPMWFGLLCYPIFMGTWVIINFKC